MKEKLDELTTLYREFLKMGDNLSEVYDILEYAKKLYEESGNTGPFPVYFIGVFIKKYDEYMDSLLPSKTTESKTLGPPK